MADGRYFYGLTGINTPKSFGPIGVGGQGNEVYVIPYKDICAVVSNIELKELDPSDENAFTHIEIINKVMEQSVILPSKFDTIFRDEKSINKCLDKVYPRVKKELKKFEDKVEMGVKVSWPSDEANAHVKKTNKNIQVLEKQLDGKSQGRRYLLRRKLEDTIKTEMNKTADRLASNIFKDIRDSSIESVKNRPVGDLILEAAFLISVESLDTFKENVEKISTKYSENHLKFTINGPWAVFNFTAIRYD